jgi:alpha-amylase
MAPIRFVFGLHLHQPVGNFDHVFEQHVRDVYRPLLEHLTATGFFPVVLHLSGPLLEWLEEHDTRYLDRLGRQVSAGNVELLLSGFYEPILAALSRADRVEQIQWMHAAVRRRFGVDARGLWLTERVWEPELAADLARAGVRYALVDDRHFLVTGFPPERLHAPFMTESDGHRVALFPIDERLRYLIPFRPPEESADYLRGLRGAGHRLAVLADDGEKFGGWPGTRDWVYGQGWLGRFTDTINGLIQQQEVRLSRLDDALTAVTGNGLAYLPTASYREMEGWALPPEAALRLSRLERDLGEERLAGPDGALVRGGHWRNFLAKYPESNRMHKKMQALSFLCRRRGNPEEPRRALGRAQCNDAYWHGVFGGLYLPHLRDAVWRNLIQAEMALRRGRPLEWELSDYDADGHEEVLVHSRAFSAAVSPFRGGALEEYILFDRRLNYANILTRRREPYHDLALARGADAGAHGEGGSQSIHELEQGLRLASRPPVDAHDRALFVDRILPRRLGLEQYAGGEYLASVSWAGMPVGVEVVRRRGAVEIVCRALHGRAEMVKRYRFDPAGQLRVTYTWDPAMASPDDWFAPEVSSASPLELECEPLPDVWTYPIETVAKSERGFDHTRQGESVTLRWPVALGRASVIVRPGI